MTATSPIPLYRSSSDLRERLVEMREDMLARMLQRGSPEPGQLPILAGIAAALKALDSREAQAPLTLDAEAAIALANRETGPRVDFSVLLCLPPCSENLPCGR